jgi:hypothetical protein
VIASQAVRTAQLRRTVHPRPHHAAHVQRAVVRRSHRTTWELRTFMAVSGAVACLFVLAMLYLVQSTTISTLGYEAQRLERVRDELRRQNALLEVQNARLDAPARIDNEARKLGLVRVATIPVVQLEPIAAKR